MYHIPEKALDYITKNQLETHIVHMSQTKNLPQQDIVVTGLNSTENGVLFVKNSKEGRNWELPTGRVEESESINEAIKREIYEETGRKVLNYSPKMAFLWVFPNKTMINIVFKIQVTETEDKTVDEILETEYFSSIPKKVSFDESGRIAYEYIVSTITDEKEENWKQYVPIPLSKPSNKTLTKAAGVTVSSVVLAGFAHLIKESKDK